jgi:hypothetical protein
MLWALRRHECLLRCLGVEKESAFARAIESKRWGPGWARVLSTVLRTALRTALSTDLPSALKLLPFQVIIAVSLFGVLGIARRCRLESHSRDLGVTSK